MSVEESSQSEHKEKIVLARKSNQTKAVANKSNANKNKKSVKPKQKAKTTSGSKRSNNESNKKKKKGKLEEENESDSDEEFDHLEAKVLPGQKYSTPPKGEPVRAFYESLFKTNPSSEMSIKYCVEYGCLSKPEAENALKKLDKLNKAKLKK